MRQVIRRASADADIQGIADKLHRFRPRAADRFLAALEIQLNILAVFPNTGTLCEPPYVHLPGLRSTPLDRFRTYVLFFLPLDDGVELVHVFHGARNFRPDLPHDEP